MSEDTQKDPYAEFREPSATDKVKPAPAEDKKSAGASSDPYSDYRPSAPSVKDATKGTEAPPEHPYRDIITHPWESIKHAADYYTRPDEKPKPVVEKQQANPQGAAPLITTVPLPANLPPSAKMPSVDMQYVNPQTGKEVKPLPSNFTERPIKSLPTDAQLEAAHRHMIEAGTKIGREVGAGYVSGATAGPGGGFVVPQGPTKSVEELRKERPITMGIAEGIGGTVGGQAADPVNWALALSGGAELPVLSKLASLAFAAKMGKDTLDGIKQLRVDWPDLNEEERAERITQLGISGIFAEEAGRHFVKGVAGPGTVAADKFAGRETAGESALPTVDKVIDVARVPAARVGIAAEHLTTPKNLISLPTAGVVGTVAHVIPVPGASEAAGLGTYSVAGKLMESVMGKEKANTPLINLPDSVIAPETRSQISIQSDLKSAKQILNKMNKDAKLKYTNVDLPIPESVQRGIDSAQAYVDEKQAAYDRAVAVRQGAVTAKREGSEDIYDQWRTATTPMSEEEAKHTSDRQATGAPLIPVELPAEYITARPGIRPVASPEVDTIGKGVSKSGSSPPTEVLIPPTPEAAQPARFPRIETAEPTAEVIPEAKSTVKPEVETRGNVSDATRESLKKSGLSDTQINRMRPEDAQAHMDISAKERNAIFEEIGKEGRTRQEIVNEQVGHLGDNNLRKTARSLGINPDEYDFNARDAKRHRTERNQLVKEVTEQMHPDEVVRHSDTAKDFTHNADQSAAAKAQRAAELFKNRLSGEPLDAYGNPRRPYGESNTVVTKAEKDAAVKRFNDKATRSNAGVDPTMLADAAKVAAYHFEAGARTFIKFSASMLAEFGEAIRPHLEQLWSGITVPGERGARLGREAARTYKAVEPEFKLGEQGSSFQQIIGSKTEPTVSRKTVGELIAPLESSDEFHTKRPMFPTEADKVRSAASSEAKELEPYDPKASPKEQLRVLNKNIALAEKIPNFPGDVEAWKAARREINARAAQSTKQAAQEPLIPIKQGLKEGELPQGFTPKPPQIGAAQRVAAYQELTAAREAVRQAKGQEAVKAADERLAKAKAAVNALPTPSVSGGSQGADVNAIASDYLKQLQRKGATIPKIEAAIPESGNIIQGVEDEAKRYGLDLVSNRGFEAPRNVEHSGAVTSRLPRINIGRATETANLVPETTSEEIQTGANRFLAPRLRAENEALRAPEDAKINQLQTVRDRLGLKHSEARSASPETLGVQKPLTESPETERLKARATAKYSYAEKPIGQEGTSVKHEVTALDPKGNMLAVVSAIEDTSSPERVWTVRGSTNAGRPGLETGYEAYSKLLRQAEAEANAKGQSITVRSDPDMLSEAAKATWSKLQRREFKNIKTTGTGNASRPSVTFEPRKPAASALPRSLGGPSQEEPTGFMGNILRKLK